MEWSGKLCMHVPDLHVVPLSRPMDLMCCADVC